MSRTYCIPEIIFVSELHVRPNPKCKACEVKLLLTDLIYSVLLDETVYIDNLTFGNLNALDFPMDGLTDILVYGNKELYDENILQKLYGTIDFVDGNYLGDEIEEAQQTLTIPLRWKCESWKFFVNLVKYFGENMSNAFRTTLTQYLRNKFTLESEHRPNIEYRVQLNDRILKMPECTMSRRTCDKYKYAIGMEVTEIATNTVSNIEDTFITLTEDSLPFFLSIFNCSSITYDFRYVLKSDSSLEMRHLKSDFIRQKRSIRNKSATIFLEPGFIFDFEKTYNFREILQEINWRHYLTAEDAGNLFGAYDDLLVNFYAYKVERVNKFKNVTINCCDLIASNASPCDTHNDILPGRYKYDVRLSETEFKDVDFNAIASIINAIPSIGNIIVDYNNVNWQASKAHFTSFQMLYYELRWTIKRELANVSMNPHDFYQITKRNNFTKILSQDCLVDFFQMNDVANFCRAFAYLIDSNCCCLKWFFEIWRRKNKQQPLSEIHVIRDGTDVKIVGNGNFFLQLNSDDNDIEVLFQYFGPEIRKARVSIEKWPNRNYSEDDKRQWITKIRDVIVQSCENLENFATADPQIGIEDNENWSEKSSIMCQFGTENEIIDDLRMGHYIIKTIRLGPQQRKAMTERIFEMILKLPHLVELNFCVPFKKIVGWKFIENINFNRETILPKLRHLHITNCQNNQPYSVEEFFNSLLKTPKMRFENTKLKLSQWSIQTTTFELFAFMKLETLELGSCTIDIDNDATWTIKLNLRKLICEDMEVPLWTFEGLSGIKLLTLRNCSNIRDADLGIILSRVPELKELFISNCPITDAFFYDYISSQPGPHDRHAKTIKWPIIFNFDDLPQCSPRVIDLFWEFRKYRYLDLIFPRVVKTEHFIQIIHAPFMEKIYDPDTSSFSTTLEEFFNSGESATVSYYNRHLPKLFETVTIRIERTIIQIIGENNFSIPFSVQLPDVEDKLQKLFRCFGCGIRNIRIIVFKPNHVPLLFEKNLKTFLQNLLNTIIEPNCKNVDHIAYASEIMDLIEDNPTLNKLGEYYFEIEAFDNELSLLDELQEKMHSISKLDMKYKSDSKGITERTIESMFKLQWVNRIHLNTWYKNISSWNFLEKIKCAEHEKILPRLQFISISSDSDEPSSPDEFENFFISFGKLCKIPMEIAELSLSGLHLTSTTFESCSFVPEVLTLWECSIAPDANIHDFQCFKNIKAVKFEEMNVPASFLKTPNPDKSYNKYYLGLERCKNMNDAELDSIIACSSAIQSVSVLNCPRISRNFFEKRPHVPGEIII